MDVEKITLIDYVKQLQTNEGLTHEQYAKKLGISRGGLLTIYRKPKRMGEKFYAGVLRAYYKTRHYRRLCEMVLKILTSDITNSK